MKLKELFTRLNALIIFLLIALCFSAIYMYNINQALVQSNRLRYKSIVISEELRKSSEDLTSYCRNYIQTGDSIWEEKYMEILDIRSGKKLRPDGGLVSLQDSMMKLGFTHAELEKLKEAEQNSNALTQTERIAFNTMKGLFADEKDHFSIKKEPDFLYAQAIVFDTSYLQAKAAIMEAIDTCIKMVEQRTQKEVGKYHRLSNIALSFIIILVLFITAISILSYILVKNKIIGQLDKYKKQKEIAEANEYKFRLLLEKSPDIVTITLPNGKIIDYNQVALKFFGEDLENEVKNLRTYQVYSNPQERVEFFEELSKNGFVRNKLVKYKNFRRTEEIDCLISAYLMDNYNGHQAVISWIRDITEHVVAQDTIRKLSRTIEQSPATIVITDTSGQIEYVNPQFTKITGYTPEEALGKNSNILKSDMYDNSFYQNLWNTISSGNDWSGEFYNKRKDDTFYWEEAVIAPIFDSKQEITNYVAIKQDITIRKNAIMALAKRKEELKELNATKNKLFSIIAHDLRGPIGNLKSFINLMLTEKDLFDEEELEKSLQQLYSTSSSTFELLENLLEWAKSQQNKIVFNPEKINIYTITEETILLLSENAKKKSIIIQNQLPKDADVMADKNMITTVFRNLISNAIKFTNANKNIYITALEDEVMTTINIKDEGIGIAPENISKLFGLSDHFTSSGTAGEKGTGLGLVLCKEFVEKNNGKIWVESNVGEGSSFNFTLPLNLTSI